MAELVDATDLKSVDLLIVRVRFPLSVFPIGERVIAFLVFPKSLGGWWRYPKKST